MAQQQPFRIPPPEIPVVDKSGKLTKDWIVHLDLSSQQLKTPANQPAPQTSGQIGQNGQIAVGGGFLYVYDGSLAKWIKFAPVPF